MISSLTKKNSSLGVQRVDVKKVVERKNSDIVTLNIQEFSANRRPRVSEVGGQLAERVDRALSLNQSPTYIQNGSHRELYIDLDEISSPLKSKLGYEEDEINEWSRIRQATKALPLYSNPSPPL